MELFGFSMIWVALFALGFGLGFITGARFAWTDLANRAETGQIWHYKDHAYRIVDWRNVFPSQQRKG